MTNDNILFESKICQEIFNFYEETLKSEKIPSHQDFINHTDSEISQYAINIFSKRDEISPGWAENKIFVTTEEQNLKKAIEDDVISFKQCKISHLISQKKEQVKDESYEVQMELLQEIHDLEKIERLLASRKGIVIFR